MLSRFDKQSVILIIESDRNDEGICIIKFIYSTAFIKKVISCWVFRRIKGCSLLILALKESHSFSIYGCLICRKQHTWYDSEMRGPNNGMLSHRFKDVD